MQSFCTDKTNHKKKEQITELSTPFRNVFIGIIELFLNYLTHQEQK